MKRSLPAAFLLMICTASAFAGQTYAIDRSHSQAKFFIRHFAETVEGTFNNMSGNITYDPSNITESKVRVAIKIASVDTSSSERDRHLQGDEFFDAKNHPEMIFESQRIEKRASGLVAVGNFTMRGTTRVIEIPFALAVDPSGRMTIHGTTQLNRRDYKVGSEEMMDNRVTLGNEVKIELDIEASPAK